MKKIVLALFSMLFLSASIFAQSDLQVLAVVKYNKNESITVKQLKSRIAVAEKQLGRKLPIEQRKEVLNTMIEEKLVLQSAQKDGISITDSQLNQVFENVISSTVGAAITEKQFDELVKEQFGLSSDEFFKQNFGMNKKEYKELLKNQTIMQQYIMYKNQDELRKIAPTDEQIRLNYEATKSSFVRKDMAKMFLVAVPNGNDSKAAKVKATELRNKLADKKVTSEQLKVQGKKEDAGFFVSEVMIEKSPQGMHMLNLTMDDLVKLFAQDVGFVTDVLESEGGYSFVSILKKYDAKMLSLSDVIQPETTITVYDYIRMSLTQQLQGQFLQQKVVELAESLNTPENVEMKKTGAALDKLLDWGD